MDSTPQHRSVKDLIENLLFLAEEPLSIKKMADSLPHSKEEIAAALDALQAEYQERGLKLRYVSGGWEITSDPAFAEEITQFFNLEKRKKLSRQAMETLTVIAYNQPITRPEIESIRGVQTSGTIYTLLECNLIRVVGQKQSLGNPFLYGTTDEFLVYFGLGDVNELPQLEFESEGLTRPKRPSDDAPSGNGETKGELTAVEFGMDPETTEVITEDNVQQMGA